MPLCRECNLFNKGPGHYGHCLKDYSWVHMNRACTIEHAFSPKKVKEPSQMSAHNKPMDLINTPVKKGGWINIYMSSLYNNNDKKSSGHIYETKEMADKWALPQRVACTYIEWEE